MKRGKKRRRGARRVGGISELICDSMMILFDVVPLLSGYHIGSIDTGGYGNVSNKGGLEGVALRVRRINVV